MKIVAGQHRCVLFDVDGTIAETEGQAHLPAFNAAMAEAGLPWRWDRKVYQRLLRTTGGFERLMRFAAESGDKIDDAATLLRQVHQSKNRHFAERMESGVVQCRAGFRELIMTLARHDIQWGVVTTTSRANWEALWRYSCATMGLPAPEVIVCGEDVAAKKPDPEAYHLALKRLGLPAAVCCAIEDSRNGLLAAKGAGLTVAIVRSEFFAEEECSEADLVVRELTELVERVATTQTAR